jgi:hypothetical protein
MMRQRLSRFASMNVAVDTIERNRMLHPDWSRKLSRPLTISGARRLKTLADVRELIRHLPAQHRRRPSWRYVKAEITDAAHSGEIFGASTALRMALMFECVVWNE